MVIIIMFKVTKTIKGKRYVYLIQNKYKDGKSVRAWEKCIGPEEQVGNIFNCRNKLPNSFQWYHFGIDFAIYEIAKRLQLPATIDSYAEKRKESEKVSDYVLLMVINRCVDPKSKYSLIDWYRKSALKFVMKIPESKVRCDNFCRHMDKLIPNIKQIESEIVAKMMLLFKIDLSCLYYDITNQYFFHEINSNSKSKLLDHGPNKAKRFDLLQVNIALLVTKDYGIPLFHESFAGNLRDVTKFSEHVEMLVNKFELFAKNCKEITLIFDKGNNSKENISKIEKYHFIGALKPYDFKHLMSISLQRYKSVYNHDRKKTNTLAYRTKENVFGAERTIILTFDEKNKKKNMGTLKANIANRYKELQKFEDKINEKLAKKRKSKWRKKQNIKEKVEDILDKKSTKSLIKYSIVKEKGKIKINRLIDQVEFRKKTKNFGKNILFTDQDKWSTYDIVAAYRNKDVIEKNFQLLKNPEIVSVKPMNHRLDKRIRAHIYQCVISLQLLALLKKVLYESKIKMSIYEILRELKDIKVIELKANGKKYRKNTDLNRKQKKIMDVLELKKYV